MASCFRSAVQHERQPRSTAQVSLDSVNSDVAKENLTAVREPACSPPGTLLPSRPPLCSSVSSATSTPPCSSSPGDHHHHHHQQGLSTPPRRGSSSSSSPKNDHRMMVSLLTAETCDPGEGEENSVQNMCWFILEAPFKLCFFFNLVIKRRNIDLKVHRLGGLGLATQM